MWEFGNAEKGSYKKTLITAKQDRPGASRRRVQWPSIGIGSTPPGWCSSMRPGPKPIAAAGLGTARSTDQSHHWQTTTLMTALRHDRITAPCFIEGSINSEAFLLYIEKVWSRPCGTATSPSCTILARPKPTPCVEPSVPQAPASSACRNTRQI
jgi:hypothetical protein